MHVEGEAIYLHVGHKKSPSPKLCSSAYSIALSYDDYGAVRHCPFTLLTIYLMFIFVSLGFTEYGFSSGTTVHFLPGHGRLQDFFFRLPVGQAT